MGNAGKYYLGLDIGTDSVGYAVTDTDYILSKFKGESMWGAMLFGSANAAADRRAFRTARRRLDRRQQRVQLLEELFAGEICKTDPYFFIRRKESSLFTDDASHGVRIFQGEGITDAEYHRQYPTIHHLIKELMESEDAHDIRLVYIACAWLLANRGHFLFDIPPEDVSDILNFEKVYGNFQAFLNDREYTLPWRTEPKQILAILQKQCGVMKKYDSFKAELFGGKKIPKEKLDTFLFNTDAVVMLLSGRTVKPKDLFCDEAYSELDSISLTMNDEDFARIAAQLGDNGDLLEHLHSIVNCAQLISTMKGSDSISSAKVMVYEQHRRDLRYLKSFVKRYCPEKYDVIFRNAVQDNYLCYSHNIKSQPKGEGAKLKHAGKDTFSDFLTKQLKNVNVSEADKSKYDDMMLRLSLRTFLPKQKDGDNRVIPQQLYRIELAALLDRAQEYTPLLSQAGADGITVRDKILSIFDFRIPYFVGPLKSGGKNAWIVRKAEGKILPWNFSDKVDLDASEQLFIKRMTNRCTYLPGEDVLPVCSLLYEKFKVLNELNNLKVNDRPIPPEIKQELYTELFERHASVSVKKIEGYLLRRGYMEKQDEISGLDKTVKSSLKSYHIFRKLIDSGKLSERDVEDIIKHRAYTEDKPRMRRWLKARYPALPDDDVSYIMRQNLKEFGRLSERFLIGIYGAEKASSGEAHTIMELLWSTNENLMQLLSDRYSFADTVRELSREYYSEHPLSLDKRLSEMYISSAVKRSIFRTFDVVRDVVKAKGCAPEKIFVEMARGGTPEQKGNRTQSRKEHLLKLYKDIRTEDSRRLTEELEAMGAMADNRLQDKRLFLYYLQFGKCAYSGQHIELSHLSDGTYNIDHIYPQCFVKDDSLLNNLVLVHSELNGRKTDIYPVPNDIRSKMQPFWLKLKESGLMEDEKYRRLTRSTSFTDDEKMGFINRQLVETRQSTKAVSALLQERFPDTEIVYVKAGMVSEFRQEFDMLKCRDVNDLHHAKDAYLNIVVGNVYHERFTKGFSVNSRYNVQTKKLFTYRLAHGDRCYWRGGEDIALVRKTVGKNSAHLTKYAFCKRGGLFDQQPVKAKEGLVPLKAKAGADSSVILSTERYGGYNKPAASFFVLARFEQKKGHELMFIPINLMDADKFSADAGFAKLQIAEMIAKITGKQPQNMELPLGLRPLKINTVISLDGTLTTLSGKCSGGQKIILSPLTPLVLGKEHEEYIKAMRRFTDKRKLNPSILPDKRHDGLSSEKNLLLYDRLVEKLLHWPFCNIPGNQGELLAKAAAREKFEHSDIIVQVNCLLGLIQLMGGKADTCDLTAVGGAAKAGKIVPSSKLSNWAKKYSDVRIIDFSAAGLFSSSSGNLLELL